MLWDIFYFEQVCAIPEPRCRVVTTREIDPCPQFRGSLESGFSLSTRILRHRRQSRRALANRHLCHFHLSSAYAWTKASPHFLPRSCCNIPVRKTFAAMMTGTISLCRPYPMNWWRRAATRNRVLRRLWMLDLLSGSSVCQTEESPPS